MLTIQLIEGGQPVIDLNQGTPAYSCLSSDDCAAEANRLEAIFANLKSAEGKFK
jgi:hypothetical protein